MFILLYRQKDISRIIEGNYRNYVIGVPDVVFMNFTSDGGGGGGGVVVA